jgi:hypothetical protein
MTKTIFPFKRGAVDGAAVPAHASRAAQAASRRALVLTRELSPGLPVSVIPRMAAFEVGTGDIRIALEALTGAGKE